VCTGLVVFFIGSGALAYAMQVPDVVQAVVALGFPVHSSSCWACGRCWARSRLWVPGVAVLKECAYAGIMFELTGAASASIATGGEGWHVAAQLSILVLVAASWELRPESRRLAGATIRGLVMLPPSNHRAIPPTCPAASACAGCGSRRCGRSDRLGRRT
jgi:DoxX-like family